MEDEKAKRPDAVKIPSNWKPSSDNPVVVGRSIARICKNLLAVDPAKGETAWVANQNGFRFATRSPYNLLYFANTHHRAKQSRYNWVLQSDGSSLGYLVEGAIEGVIESGDDDA